MFKSIDEKQKKLDELKEGDQVAIETGFNFRNYKITTITRITPTRRIKTESGDEFNKDGYERTSKNMWGHRKRLEPITPEIIDFIKRKKAINKIDNFDIKKLSTDQLERMVAIINEQ